MAKNTKVQMSLFDLDSSGEIVDVSQDETLRDDVVLYWLPEADWSRDSDGNPIPTKDPRWDSGIQELTRATRFGLDIETYGVDDYSGALNPTTGEIRLISVGLPSGLAMVADLGAMGSDRETTLKRLTPFLQVLKHACKSRRQLTIMQNGVGFEVRWLLHKLGIRIRNMGDTMLMSQILWAGLHYGFIKGRENYSPHALDSIVERLELPYAIEKSQRTQRSDWGVPHLTNRQLNYSAMDSIVMLPVEAKLRKLLIEAGLQKPFEATMKAAPQWGEMMHWGMPVSQEVHKEILGAYAARQKEQQEIFQSAFPGVNQDSPPQLLKALRQAYPQTDLPNTKDETLSFLATTEPAIRALLNYRSLGTQVDYLRNISARWFWDERLKSYFVRSSYTTIAPSGMGRSSCAAPNLQNPSNLKSSWEALGLRSVRDIFVAPPGYKIIISDLSQAHIFIGADSSGDAALNDAQTNKKDVHLMTASALAKIRGLTWDYDYLAAVRKDKTHPDYVAVNNLRSLSKPVFYGSQNLQGEDTLRRTAASADPPIFMTVDDAKEGKAAWRETYSGLAAHQKELIAEANRFNHRLVLGGRVIGAKTGIYGEARGMCGRRLFLEKTPDVSYDDREKYTKSEINQAIFGASAHCLKTGQMLNAFMGIRLKWSVKGTDCVSSRWMMTEATAMNAAMGDALEWFDANPQVDGFVIRMCHDEINVLVREEQALEVATMLKSVMDKGMKDLVRYFNNDSPEKSICTCLSEK